MRKFLSLFALLLIASTALSAISQAQKIVLGIEGRWWDSGGHELGFGSQVTGQCVYGESGLLQVVDSKSKAAQAFTYDKLPPECKIPCSAKVSPIPANARCSSAGSALVLASESHATQPVNEARPTVAHGFGGYWDLLFRKPQTFVVAAARGIEEEPQESILLLSGSEIDLAPALQTVSQGKYVVTLEPLNGGKGDSSEQGRVSWATGAPAKIKLARNKPGLYRLSITVEGGDSEGSDIWVLVADKSHYAADVTEFDESVSMSKSWGDKVDSAGKRALLRACLQSLADRDAGK
jgi:hypothetical protein